MSRHELMNIRVDQATNPSGASVFSNSNVVSSAASAVSRSHRTSQTASGHRDIKWTTLEKWKRWKPSLKRPERDEEREYADESGQHDHRHVVLPSSPHSTLKRGGLQISKWPLVQRALAGPFENPEDLEAAISAYISPGSGKRFSGLAHFFLDLHPNTKDLFGTVIPAIAEAALCLPRLFPNSIPVLAAGCNASVTLSHRQILCILANAFFCTFSQNFYGSLPYINFLNLFAGAPKSGLCSSLNEAKLHGLFEYFKRRTDSCPEGSVTFHRRYLAAEQLPKWTALRTTRLARCEVRSTGRIEDEGRGMIQMDFANKFIGGGVLGKGAVQEEILFIINPELIASRLFVEELQPSEALFMIGSERFSHYTGYSKTFEWSGSYYDTAPRDFQGRLMTEIVAIDALLFLEGDDLQFRRPAILRELNKAYSGFLPSEVSCFSESTPIATGNWGCGAFNGDPELKFLIQLIAASAANRRLVYFTFEDETLLLKMTKVLSSFEAAEVTAGELYAMTLAYVREAEAGQSPLDYVLTVMDAVQEAMQDH
ncbi:hypothetical protein DFJ73DRAFT_823320 [Zopfochytrium polystomum]|nr:hypothetical protein DFJ73DRAFT_823320 [Zopfochytrium polystomum]